MCVCVCVRACVSTPQAVRTSLLRLGISCAPRASNAWEVLFETQTTHAPQAPEVSLILATGGPAMVRSAYSSGHPSVGVGEWGAGAAWGAPSRVCACVGGWVRAGGRMGGCVCLSAVSYQEITSA